MHQILALAAKDLRLLVRDRAGFFFTFVLPVLFAIFFGFIFSGGGGGGDARLEVAIVDQDRTDASRDFIARLQASEALEVVVLSEPAPEAPDQRAPADRARDAVRRGAVTAYVLIAQGFGASSERLFQGESLRLVVGVDPSRTAEAGLLQGLLTQAAFEQLSRIFTDTAFLRRQTQTAMQGLQTNASPAVRAVLTPFLGSLSNLADGLDNLESAPDGADGANASPFKGFNPVEIVADDVQRERRGPANSFEVSFPQGIAWGLISGAFGFGLSLVQERVRGTLVRLRVAPIHRWQVVAGKGLACFVLLALIVTGMMLLGLAPPFNVRPNSVPLLAIAILSIAACWTGVMMCIAVLGKTEAAVNGIGWAVLMPMAMIGGGMVPLFLMPDWMGRLAVLSPVRWSVRALEGALWRDFTPAEMLGCCAVLVSIGLGGFLVGSRVFAWSIRE